MREYFLLLPSPARPAPALSQADSNVLVASPYVFLSLGRSKAFNETPATRVVLIVDLARPPGVPKGRAVGDRTPELNNIIEYFS